MSDQAPRPEDDGQISAHPRTPPPELAAAPKPSAPLLPKR
jgi:hypothetical protein